VQTLHGSWVVYVMDRFICRDDRYIILIKSDVVLTTRRSDFATNFWRYYPDNSTHKYSNRSEGQAASLTYLSLLISSNVIGELPVTIVTPPSSSSKPSSTICLETVCRTILDNKTGNLLTVRVAVP